MDAFGIDIGGSGIKGAPVELEKGCFAAERLRIPTPEASTPDAVARVCCELLDNFRVDPSVPVGVAFPAPIHPGRPIGYMANLDKSWIGVDITTKLSEACHRPVRVVNDADSARQREDLSWKKWGKRLTKYLRLLEFYLSPEAFVIGGGVSKKHEKYFPYIEVDTPVYPAKLLNDAGIVGAASFAAERR